MNIRWIWRMMLTSLLVVYSSTFAQTSATDKTIPTTIASSDDVVLTKDRFEGFNRGAYQFNDGWDQVLFKPIAKGYKKVVPSAVRGCIHGIFENLNTPYTAMNNILQGKFKAAGQDMCRFVVNTTVGLGGCIDVASKLKIPKHDEDFGQTLGVWGVPAGPFIMLPVLGPSTLRDTLAKPIDFIADPVGYIKVIKIRNLAKTVNMLDVRAGLMDALDATDGLALDKYALIRDVWLQNREARVRDEDYEPDVAPLPSEPEPVKATTPAVPVEAAPVEVQKASQPSERGGLKKLNTSYK